jgi:hypothetical protein
MGLTLHFIGRRSALVDEVEVRDGTDVIDTLVLRLDDPTARSAYARQVAAQLNGRSAPADDLERAFAELATEAAGEAEIVRLATVQRERVSWLWRGWLALGKLTICDGDPGVGKSVLTSDLGARVSTGRAMPDGSRGVLGGVVILSAEDGLGDTIVPRLLAAGADCNRVVALTLMRDDQGERLPCIPDDIAAIEAAIAEVDARLVIIDPLMAYLGAGTNSWRDQDIRRALAPLAAMAERTGVAVLIIRHLNKATTMSPLYRGGGSIGIVGAARSAWMVGYVPDAATKGLRFLAVAKSNLARPPEPLCWTVEAEDDVPVVAWGNVLPDFDLAVALGARSGGDADTPTKLDEAQRFLVALLGDGPVAVKQIQAEAKAAGFAQHTIERAKQELGLVAGKEGFGKGANWSWRLPEQQIRLPDAPPGADDAEHG